MNNTEMRSTTPSASGSTAGNVKGWPEEVGAIQYATDADNSRQPALFYAPPTEEKKPLLVALHTWSGDYRQAASVANARWCIQMNWCFIHPNFRGPNWTPEALGSELVIEDIVSAVQYAQTSCAIDMNRIYLIGGSGGGHAALLLAGHRPDLWAGISAWCGIFDIRKWWEETKAAKRGYADHIEKACGGPPDINTRSAEECLKRSPLTYLKNAASVNLDINAGVKDGRSGSVPFTHSLYAFNAVARENDRIDMADIKQFYRDMKVPAHLASDMTDPLYGKRQPLFRKISNNVRITVFDGGHDIIHAAALNWLAQQRKDQPAVWDIPMPAPFQASDHDAKSGLGH
ncbi:MAG: prolyl oligopeptidase family serine peptidase [Kiritimatiellae bacterium]|nr:prolyl oligopeptidase family serine peptidase [Verrucomicrobiota bacterium]MCG2679489.1 prolyl oligopeptidase family serine peptidase [Kiritimatiellia bacterium]